MTVTRVSAVAVSFRATTVDAPAAGAPPPGDTAQALRSDDTSSSALSRAERRSAAVSRRAETLFRTLDADADGSVTPDEFTNGAIELLKRASVRAHHRHVGHGDGVGKRDAHWRARLEQAFARVDVNHDGSVDQDELTAGLQAAPRKGYRRSECSGPAAGECAPTATAVTSVTFVAVAIRRYTVAAASPAPPAAAEPVRA